MTANPDLLLAMTAAGGADGLGMAWFAPVGTTAPTSATSSLAAGFLDAGECSESGLVGKKAETIKDINVAGSFTPARRLVTQSVRTFDITFRESNSVSLAIYNRKALGSLTVTSGALDFTEGAVVDNRYAAVFDIIDTAKGGRIRAYCPNVGVESVGDFNAAQGENIAYPVTLTAYLVAGVSVHWFYAATALA